MNDASFIKRGNYDNVGECTHPDHKSPVSPLWKIALNVLYGPLNEPGKPGVWHISQTAYDSIAAAVELADRIDNIAKAQRKFRVHKSLLRSRR